MGGVAWTWFLFVFYSFSLQHLPVTNYSPSAWSAGRQPAQECCSVSAIVLFEMRLRQVSLKRLIGAVIGSISRHHRRLPLQPGHPQQHPSRPTQSFLQLLVMLIMAYVWPGRGRRQGRPAEPGCAGRHLRRREAGQAQLQDPGHQCHHRRPHRRHRRDRLPRRRAS